MDDLKQIDEKLEAHASRVKEIGDEVRSVVEQTDTESKARFDELQAEQKRITEEVAPLLADKERAEQKASIDATQAKLESLLAATRTASKAIGNPTPRSFDDAQYKAGSFLGAIVGLNDRDPEVYTASKATLDSISAHEESWGKATLGTTDALGGWIVPNAIVDEFIRPASASNIWNQLLTVRDGVTAFAVDIPFRSAQPARAVIAPFGSTKENVDLAYNGYTATMYTLARIHDIGNQFLRQSQGAAEADVMASLAEAFQLGESYYIREGAGTTEPWGFTVALTNGPAAFRSSFTPSAATLAGSIYTAIATAAGALAGRAVKPTAAVVAATAYWTMAAQGLDGSGFFYAPFGGPAAINPGTLMTPFGIPVFPDAAADQQGTAAVLDNLIVGDFKSAKVYHGQSYRVESSSVAGTRWDANVTGFRGEMELGFDARPAVYSGHFQAITDILPS